MNILEDIIFKSSDSSGGPVPPGPSPKPGPEPSPTPKPGPEPSPTPKPGPEPSPTPKPSPSPTKTPNPSVPTPHPVPTTPPEPGSYRGIFHSLFTMTPGSYKNIDISSSGKAGGINTFCTFGYGESPNDYVGDLLGAGNYNYTFCLETLKYAVPEIFIGGDNTFYKNIPNRWICLGGSTGSWNDSTFELLGESGKGVAFEKHIQTFGTKGGPLLYNGILFDIEAFDVGKVTTDTINKCLMFWKNKGYKVIICSPGFGIPGELGTSLPSNVDLSNLNTDYIDGWMLMMYALGNDSQDPKKGGADQIVNCLLYHSGNTEVIKNGLYKSPPKMPLNKMMVAWSFNSQGPYITAMNQKINGKTVRETILGEFYWGISSSDTGGRPFAWKCIACANNAARASGGATNPACCIKAPGSC